MVHISHKMRSWRIMKLIIQILVLLFLLSVLFGCSATSLRCSTDGDSSYVELYNLPQNVSQNVRAYSELCGFVYDGGE